MIADRDIWQAAKLLVDRYGEGGPEEAAQRATNLRAEGDSDGEAIRFRIENACRELLRAQLGPSGRVS